jgi:hypothetical protein
VHFDDVSTQASYGGTTLKVATGIGGAQMPAGVTFGGEVQFEGFTCAQVA